MLPLGGTILSKVVFRTCPHFQINCLYELPLSVYILKCFYLEYLKKLTYYFPFGFLKDLDDIEDENEQLKQENKTLLKVVGQLTR